VAFAVAMALAQRYAPGLLMGPITPQTWLVLVPLVLIGVIDDWRNLPSAVRYLVQLGTAWYVVSVYGAFTFPWLDQLGSLAAPWRL
jgi:UDP-N-acetylmuramyl pentapeptide phosphotransferase/UDP-N-acetylglucosamine-1-phosphate transferase